MVRYLSVSSHQEIGTLSHLNRCYKTIWIHVFMPHQILNVAEEMETHHAKQCFSQSFIFLRLWGCVSSRLSLLLLADRSGVLVCCYRILSFLCKPKRWWDRKIPVNHLFLKYSEPALLGSPAIQCHFDHSPSHPFWHLDHVVIFEYIELLLYYLWCSNK